MTTPPEPPPFMEGLEQLAIVAMFATGAEPVDLTPEDLEAAYGHLEAVLTVVQRVHLTMHLVEGPRRELEAELVYPDHEAMRPYVMQGRRQLRLTEHLSAARATIEQIRADLIPQEDTDG